MRSRARSGWVVGFCWAMLPAAAVAMLIAARLEPTHGLAFSQSTAAARVESAQAPPAAPSATDPAGHEPALTEPAPTEPVQPGPGETAPAPIKVPETPTPAPDEVGTRMPRAGTQLGPRPVKAPTRTPGTQGGD